MQLDYNGLIRWTLRPEDRGEKEGDEGQKVEEDGNYAENRDFRVRCKVATTSQQQLQQQQNLFRIQRSKEATSSTTTTELISNSATGDAGATSCHV